MKKYDEKPRVSSSFMTGLRNGLLMAIPLWAIIIGVFYLFS